MQTTNMFNITDLFSSLDSSGNEGQQQQQQQFQPPDAATALSLDDIFNDVMFTPDGQAVFMSEQQPLQFDDPINSPADDVQDVFDDNPIPIHLPSPTPMPFIPSGELQVTNSASKLQTGDGAAFDVAALLQQQQLQQQQLHQQLQAAQLQQQQQLQQQPRFVPVPRAGGLYATQLHQPEKPSLVMGPFNESLQSCPLFHFKSRHNNPIICNLLFYQNRNKTHRLLLLLLDTSIYPHNIQALLQLLLLKNNRRWMHPNR